jgi:hypothetical protein
VASWEKSRQVIFSNEELRKDAFRFCRMGTGGFWVMEEHVILDKIGKK